MKDEELKRILENLDTLKPIFDRIDEQIDASLKISWETLNRYIDI